MDEAVHIAVKQWLEKASNDLRTAETMLSVNPPVTDTSCYHAQQCVEKALKACLTWAGKHVERTHNLPRLIELCDTDFPGISQWVDAAVELTDYATETRYPDDWREIPVSEASVAVQHAKEVFTWIQSEIDRKKVDDLTDAEKEKPEDAE